MKKDTPKHYKGTNGGDTIAHINGRDGIQSSINFCLDNTLKYATRLWRKESPVDDARKIVVYANRAYNDLLKEIEDRSRNNPDVIDFTTSIDKEVVWADINYIANQLGKREVISYLQGIIITNSKHISLNQQGYLSVLDQLFLMTILAESLLGHVKNVCCDGFVDEDEDVSVPENEEEPDVETTTESNDILNTDAVINEFGSSVITLALNILNKVNKDK